MGGGVVHAILTSHAEGYLGEEPRTLPVMLPTIAVGVQLWFKKNPRLIRFGAFLIREDAQ